jgi:hypothetical protein
LNAVKSAGKMSRKVRSVTAKFSRFLREQKKSLINFGQKILCCILFKPFIN